MLDIPAYDEDHQEFILKKLKAQIDARSQENREESWRLNPKDDDGIATIAVKTDGTPRKLTWDAFLDTSRNKASGTTCYRYNGRS